VGGKKRRVASILYERRGSWLASSAAPSVTHGVRTKSSPLRPTPKHSKGARTLPKLSIGEDRRKHYFKTKESRTENTFIPRQGRQLGIKMASRPASSDSARCGG